MARFLRANGICKILPLSRVCGRHFDASSYIAATKSSGDGISNGAISWNSQKLSPGAIPSPDELFERDSSKKEFGDITNTNQSLASSLKPGEIPQKFAHITSSIIDRNLLCKRFVN